MNEAKKMKRALPYLSMTTQKTDYYSCGTVVCYRNYKVLTVLNVGNIQSIGKQLTEYGLMSLGMGVCMLSGGIDLSTVYIANLCGISAGLIIQSNTSGAAGIVLACVVALVVGALCGIFNGFWSAFLIFRRCWQLLEAMNCIWGYRLYCHREVPFPQMVGLIFFRQ